MTLSFMNIIACPPLPLSPMTCTRCLGGERSGVNVKGASAKGKDWLTFLNNHDTRTLMPAAPTMPLRGWF